MHASKASRNAYRLRIGTPSAWRRSLLLSPRLDPHELVQYAIRLRKGLDRGQIAARSAASRYSHTFLPIHLQPYMVERFGYRKGYFPGDRGSG